ncbi:hypothetical protein [Granulicella sp. L60]|uniref:hypothetical protein n=1 Tax=Granulicella sp. L60 TaxID=1641866 RepID=UPI00131C5F66|nr:hypothetical protein [Granulicella sp. L60]
MKISLAILLSLTSAITLAQQPPPQQQPANVAGKWTIYAKDPNGGTSTKYIEIVQKGNVITGHFKGPNQSGGIEGTINMRHIVFHTKTREVLNFGGQVEGPNDHGNIQATAMRGNFHARGGAGEWQAVPSN